MPKSISRQSRRQRSASLGPPAARAGAGRRTEPARRTRTAPRRPRTCPRPALGLRPRRRTSAEEAVRAAARPPWAAGRCAIEVEPTMSKNSAPTSRSSRRAGRPRRSAAWATSSPTCALEQVADALALAQALGHAVEAGLDAGRPRCRRPRHVSVEVTAPTARARRAPRQRLGDGTAANSAASRPTDRRQPPRKRIAAATYAMSRARLQNPAPADDDHAQQRHPGAEQPGHGQAPADVRGNAALARPHGERARGHGPQHPLGHEVEQRAGGLAAEPDGGADDGPRSPRSGRSRSARANRIAAASQPGRRA